MNICRHDLSNPDVKLDIRAGRASAIRTRLAKPAAGRAPQTSRFCAAVLERNLNHINAL
jgi:hypothetical protein